ncbi:putative late blight resistance protein homolog R1B-8 isoform X2 [Salvia miltiorrhiza]|uniref:putative late blight resistance protein homolog R1B-8 isoform X2 n=1 Tax=Salvia miltiorrhiza TaxID=226208 RepID=UPI0025ABCC63|nr:putative late blight resistance protein homolog R1B-8 isoform X2 [Salvia miltiorrhiza]
MAAYAALLSLAQTTHLNTYQHQSLFSSEAEEKVRSIHDYVSFLLLFFEDFPQKVNRWEGRIRDAAYQIEDIIEVFICHRIQRHPSRVKLEDQLQNVMEEIGLVAGEVMEERPTYLPASSSSSSRLASTGNDAVIGLDDDITAIKERLCGQSPNLRVVPIVGMGGIGKTTLAKAVYDDQLIIERFDIRAWVVASQDYSPHRFRKLLLDSMKLLEDQMSADVIDESDIELKVYKKLKGWRYLIVIDDVWGTNIWDDVRYMFPDDKNGSRIMLTTRQLDVASYPDTAGPLHDMRLMDCSQSWDLLRLKVFTDGYCTPDLEDVGTEIARRCAGLPLAVVLAAGVLSSVIRTKASWEEIAKNVNPVVGWELEEILSFSYTYLPHHLRLCFLFIGGFLEDASIRASRLIRLWVAEGFLKHQNGGSKSLEEEAEECLDDLVKRNLVIVTSRKTNGKIKSCSLHDMVRDLCIRIAREEKFLHVMDGRDLPQGLMNERRISFSRSDIDKIWGPTFRTILCFQMKIFPSWLAMLGSYKLLRILDALHVNLKELPTELFDLHWLRYLALMGSFSIPSAVSNLVNLQTLVIHLEFGKLRRRYDDGVRRSLPLEIWRLPQLRHLFFHAPYMLPHPLEGFYLPLENLQTLLLVKNLVWNEKILQLIPNVKRLGLTYSSNEDHHLHHLKDLHQLEQLKMIGYRDFSWRGQSPTFPCALKKLTLVGGGFLWKDMAIVGSLPNLEILKLLGNACDGETWETTDEDFPRLKFLLIDESHLREWITHSNPFPTLRRLVLRSCCYLREIPEGIGEIPTLELIEVDYCTNSLVESAMKIKEDQESYGNYDLQVLAGHEEIQLFYKRMALSPSRPATLRNAAVIGLDDDLVAIKEQLCGLSSQLQVVSIVGLVGIGKTTLARTVYYDPLLLEHFEIRAWLTLSLDYSTLRLRKQILLGLLDSMELLDEHMSGEKIREPEMLNKIHQRLMGRRYLVVMDDVWSTEVWGGISNIFPNDENGSRIMLTTRLADAGSYDNSGNFLHRMQLMDDYQSWNLLKQKVFENINCPSELEDIGKEIAQRCAGLPLGVVLIAGVLSAVDKTEASWNKISKKINPNFGPPLREILSFSYTQLPRHLKPCFLCMGEFAKNKEGIHASKLIELWVDKGFLKHENGCSESLKEKAEEYLEDLVKRNLVTVSSRKSNGKIKYCSLHYMLRDLCIRKAQDEWIRRICERPAERPAEAAEPTKTSFFMLLMNLIFYKAR